MHAVIRYSASEWLNNHAVEILISQLFYYYYYFANFINLKIDLKVGLNYIIKFYLAITSKAQTSVFTIVLALSGILAFGKSLL